MAKDAQREVREVGGCERDIATRAGRSCWERAISSYGEIVMPMWGLGLRVGGRHQRRSIRIRVGAHVKMITGQAQGRMEVFCIYYIST